MSCLHTSRMLVTLMLDHMYFFFCFEKTIHILVRKLLVVSKKIGLALHYKILPPSQNKSINIHLNVYI